MATSKVLPRSVCLWRRYSTVGPTKKPRIIKHKYVPDCHEPSHDEVKSLQDFLDRHKRTLVITGAGLSTESGIPDYRSAEVGLYARKNYKPMQYQQFISSAALRQRYWARSYVGWPGYSKIMPSDNHQTLSKWERAGLIHWLITQNVDHLHVKAGSEKITELHGTLYETACLSCKQSISRSEFQTHIEHVNPEWTVQSFEIATDGDVFLTDEQVEGFKVPECTSCGGDMMPKIVFFGDNVNRQLVEFLYKKVEESDAVLVLGSSLQVFSGFRFIRTAAELNKQIAIVNIGATRGDSLANLKIHSKCGDILPLIKC